MLGYPTRLALAEAVVDPLTEREMEVLPLLSEGLSNKEIAARLIVAPSTVKQHRKNIYGKFDVHSRTQAVARGRELALLQHLFTSSSTILFPPQRIVEVEGSLE